MKKFDYLLMVLMLLVNLSLKSEKVLLVLPERNQYEEMFFPGLEFQKVLATALNNLGHRYRFVYHSLPNDYESFSKIIFIDPSKNEIVNNARIQTLVYVGEPFEHPNTMDPVKHMRYTTLLTWANDKVDNKKYHKLLYTQALLYKDYKPEEDILRDKFCCLFGTGYKSHNHPNELYSARKRTLNYFKKHAFEKMDLYGPGWDKGEYPFYKGIIVDKISCLKQYKFSICYENVHSLNGYVSEKILHCFFGGCVPVYWGAADIDYYVPANCYVDRSKFKSEKELYDFLTTMSDDVYQQYQQNIRNYLNSDQFLLFSPIYFCEIVLKAILPDYNRVKAFSAEQVDILEKIDTLPKPWKS